MIKFQAETTINRPIDEVFRYTADPHKQQEWTDMGTATMLSQGPIGQGTRYSTRFKKGPIKEMIFEVTAYVPNRTLGYRGTGGPVSSWVGDMRFEPAGPSSTRVMSQGEIQLRGLWKLLEPLMSGEVRRGEAAELVKLKEILESSR